MPSHIQPIKRILVATDLTQESIGAVLLARWLTDQLQAELHAVHVIEPVSNKAEQAMPGLAARHEAQAREELERFAQAHDLRSFTNLHVALGQADHEVIKLGENLNADLVVIGRWGQGGMRRGSLGSVANHILRKYPHSVLIVQPDFRAPIQRIGVASACEDELNIELERGMDLAARLRVPEINLVTAYEVPAGYHMLSSYEDAVQKLGEVHEQIATQQVHEATASAPAAVRVNVASELGPPVKVLSDFAAEAHLDLLVISTHARTLPAEFLLDNVSERVVNHAQCNIWAEKHPAESQTLKSIFQSLID